jgi:hypothetical protein
VRVEHGGGHRIGDRYHEPLERVRGGDGGLTEARPERPIYEGADASSRPSRATARFPLELHREDPAPLRLPRKIAHGAPPSCRSRIAPSLQAKAYDAAGNIGASKIVSVGVTK